MPRRFLPWIFPVAVALAVAAIWYWRGPVQPELTQLHWTIDRWRDWSDGRPILSVTAFLLASVLLNAMPLPVLVPISIAAGAIFDFWPALAMVSLTSTLAACLSMQAARHGLTGRLGILQALADRLDRALARGGSLALLSLRLAPGMPFFALNFAAGLSRIGLRPFALTTFLGKLPAIAILAGAGNQLADIRRVSDIMTPEVIAMLALLAVFPLLARWAVAAVRTARAR